MGAAGPCVTFYGIDDMNHSQNKLGAEMLNLPLISIHITDGVMQTECELWAMVSSPCFVTM